MKARLILAGLCVFVLGAAGGIWSQAFLLPTMAANPSVQNWQFIKDWNARTVITRPVREVTIDQSEAGLRVIERSRRAVVGIQSSFGGDQITGTGLIVTSDGLLVTLARLVPAGYAPVVYIAGEAAPVSAKVLKRDLEADLALLQISKSNLSTVELGNADDVVLGSKLFLVGASVEKAGLANVFDEGAIKWIQDGSIATTIARASGLQGSALFNSSLRAIGLAAVSADGTVSVVSPDTLHSFLGM